MPNTQYSTEVVLYDEAHVDFFVEQLPEASLDRRMAIDYLGRVASMREQMEMLERSKLDDLTGALRLQAFNSRFEDLVREQAEVSQSERKSELAKQGLGVMFLDLDGFGDVNNTLGHPIGDSLLVEVVDRLKKVVRDDDLVCRKGGDEFLIGLNAGIDEEAMQAVAERIIDRVADIEVAGRRGVVTVSIGGCMYFDGATAEAMIEISDKRMYQAKHSGKNRFVLSAEDQ